MIGRQVGGPAYVAEYELLLPQFLHDRSFRYLDGMETSQRANERSSRQSASAHTCAMIEAGSSSANPEHRMPSPAKASHPGSA
jgi:hypothetical protein